MVRMSPFCAIVLVAVWRAGAVSGCRAESAGAAWRLAMRRLVLFMLLASGICSLASCTVTVGRCAKSPHPTGGRLE